MNQPPKIKRISARKGILLKNESFVFGKNTLILKKGFDFDGASIPRFMHWLYLPFDTETLRASLMHDFLYWSHFTDRKTADEIFLQLMEESGTPLMQRILMFWAVRLCGWIYFYITPIFKDLPDNKEIKKYLQIKQTVI